MRRPSLDEIARFNEDEARAAPTPEASAPEPTLRSLWGQFPDARRATDDEFVANLLNENADLRATVAALTARLAEEKELADLAMDAVAALTAERTQWEHQQNAGGSTMKSEPPTAAAPNQPQEPEPSRDASRALDALVAVKVMGWASAGERQMWSLGEDGSDGEPDGTAWMGQLPRDQRTHPEQHQHLPHYSTDMRAAWLVVECLDATLGHWDGQHVSWTFERGPGPGNGDEDGDGFLTPGNVGGWGASFYAAGYRWLSADAATLPLAICRVALATRAAPRGDAAPEPHA